MQLIQQPVELSLVMIASGLAILFFGRQLFWLYLGVVGMLIGFELAGFYSPQAPLWIVLVSGAFFGIIAALAAVFMQYVAVGVAGFVGGSYLALQILEFLPVGNLGELQWVLLLIPAVAGAVLCILVFDLALICLSSLTGAVILVQLFVMDSQLQNILFVIVALAGFSVQYLAYSRGRKRPTGTE